MIPRISAILAASLATSLWGCALDSRNPSQVDPDTETLESESGTGGSAGSDSAQLGGAGAGGSAAAMPGNGGGTGSATARPADCAEAQVLPDNIFEDRTIGPGCVRMQRSQVARGATLTILPGTTVLMESAAYLNVDDVDSHLVALGTAEEPILFTSASNRPLPGDWQCVRIGRDGSNSELEHVVFEYGGQACAATGSGDPSMLGIDAPLRGIRDVTIRDSLNYGVSLYSTAAVRAFSNNHFARNGQASIRVAASQVFALGTGNTFEDADDHIEVTNGSIGSNGTWLNQGVPFRVQDLGVTPEFNVTIAAGVRFEMSGSIDAFNANFNIEGTEAEPVVFTSAQENPQPGDWGCLLYSYTTVTPRIDHAIFEYAGSGRGCLGSNIKAALIAPNSSNITNTIFRYIDGVGISARFSCNVADWCQNQFIDVSQGPFECEGTFTPCPAQ